MQKSNEPATDPRVGRGEFKDMTRAQVEQQLAEARQDRDASIFDAIFQIEEISKEHAEEKAELEVQLAEANRERDMLRDAYMDEAKRVSVYAELRNKAEAEAAKLRGALVKVEAYMAGEDGPIYRLWEDADICNYDNRECEWQETLAEVRDFKLEVSWLGYGTEWPVITLYREVLAALEAPEAARHCATCGSADNVRRDLCERCLAIYESYVPPEAAREVKE